MKNKFAVAAKKIQLFSEHATVLSYVFGEAKIKTTVGDVVVKDEKYDGKVGQTAILDGLTGQKIPYEVISRDESSIHLAVPRSKKADALKAIDAALSGGVHLALNYSLIQESSPLSPILDAIARPFSRVRRDVAKSLQKLGS